MTKVITDLGLKREVLNLKKNPIVNRITYRTMSGDGIPRSAKVEYEYFNKTGKTGKYYRQYITDKHGYDIDTYVKLKRKTTKKAKEELAAWGPVPEVTHGDIWDWREQQYFNGNVKIKEKAVKAPDPLELPDWLVNEAIKRGKGLEVSALAYRLPTVKKAMPVMRQLFKLIQTYTDEFFFNLGRFKSIQDWHYEHDNDFVRQVNELKYIGIGCTEILLVIQIDGASMMGGNTSFDLVIDNEHYNKQYVVEVKSDVTSSTSFRLGKASLASYPAFNKVCNIFIELERHMKTNNFEPFITYEEYKLLCDSFYVYEEWRKLEEFSGELLRRLHLFLYHFCDISERVSQFGFLRSFDYIRNPENLMIDLESCTTQYFDDHPDLDELLIVREREKFHCGPDDLVFAAITNGGNVKIIEKEKGVDRSGYEENVAYDLWRNKLSGGTYNQVYNLCCERVA